MENGLEGEHLPDRLATKTADFIEQHQDGKSIVNVPEGSSELVHEAIFWHYPHYGNQGGAPGSAIREGNWKLIHWYEDDRYELYKLKEDIGEKQNVASGHPEEVERLKMELDQWIKEVDGKIPSPNPASAQAKL